VDDNVGVSAYRCLFSSLASRFGRRIPSPGKQRFFEFLQRDVGVAAGVNPYGFGISAASSKTYLVAGKGAPKRGAQCCRREASPTM
jgi:hypothetical protein